MALRIDSITVFFVAEFLRLGLSPTGLNGPTGILLLFLGTQPWASFAANSFYGDPFLAATKHKFKDTAQQNHSVKQDGKCSKLGQLGLTHQIGPI